jgi:hypothetical protein
MEIERAFRMSSLPFTVKASALRRPRFEDVPPERERPAV